MKVSLVYPKIPDCKGFLPKQCVAFEKLDGTNVHFLWDRKYGWSKFGTRRKEYSFSESDLTLFKTEHPELQRLGCVPKQSEILDEILYTKYSCDSAIIFAEFFGEHSFAGAHVEEKKQEIIFDIMIDGIFIPPLEFIDNFDSLEIPKVIYKGKFSGQLVEDIRNGKYPVNEGAVIKGVYKDEVYMCKVKTNAYMERLKKEFGNKWEDYWE